MNVCTTGMWCTVTRYLRIYYYYNTTHTTPTTRRTKTKTVHR